MSLNNFFCRLFSFGLSNGIDNILPGQKTSTDVKASIENRRKSSRLARKRRQRDASNNQSGESGQDIELTSDSTHRHDESKVSSSDSQS